MKVLIGCEYSGVVREAFKGRRHDAWSCDILPTEIPGNHYQCNVLSILDKGWDLAIFHPPCTYILNSGVRWLYKNGRRFNKDGTENPRDLARWAEMESGARFFKALLNCVIPKICVENPIMCGHALEIIGEEATQFIQPWKFGHGEMKATGLWLRGLPLLTPTNIVDGREQRIHKMPPGKNRGKDRSLTFAGIANAFAEQWG